MDHATGAAVAHTCVRTHASPRVFSSSGINERYGVRLIYGGIGHPSLAPAEGGDWDMVALVSYPSRQHFVDMINDPTYQEFKHLRDEAVATAVLQPTTPAS